MRFLLALTLLGTACIPPEVSIEGRPCPCPAEFTCDEATSTCQAAPAEGASGPGAAGPGGAGGVGAGPTSGGGGAGGAGGAPVCMGVCDTAGCPACPDIPVVTVTDFVIDATEVRVEDYVAFLDADVDPATQANVCSFNASFHPHDAVDANGSGDCATFDLTALDEPIGCVDWCDAAAFCAWRGMHLCGKRGGGTLMKVAADLDDPTKSEWFAACSNEGAQAFPYGDVEDPDLCNTAGGIPAGGAVDVGTYDECEGGVMGLFDMVGNVEEWEAACDTFGATTAQDNCELRGGAFWSDGSEYSRCGTGNRGPDRGTASHDWGFRCCGALR